MPRLVNLGLGGWLFWSAFLWRHTPAQRANALVCGMLAVIFAASGLYSRPARFLNALVGAWLFASAAYMIRAQQATLWNEVVVGAAMFLVSLIPGRDGRRRVSMWS